MEVAAVVVGGATLPIEPVDLCEVGVTEPLPNRKVSKTLGELLLFTHTGLDCEPIFVNVFKKEAKGCYQVIIRLR